MSSGVGSGKSRLLCLFSYLEGIRHRGGTHLVVGPDYTFIRTELIPAFQKLLAEMGLFEGLHYEVNLTVFEISFPWGAKTRFMTAKAPIDAFRGINASSVAVDEIADLPSEIWTELLTRLRGKGVLHSLRVGVPQFDTQSAYWREMTSPEFIPVGSYEVAGEKFTRAKYNAKSKTITFFGSTAENLEYLGKEYLINLARQFGYSEALYANQCHGQFRADENDSLFTFSYDRSLTTAKLDPSIPEILVSLDFNLGQTCGVIGYKKSGKILISNSFKAKDTDSACRELIALLPPSIYRNHRILVTGDCNGHKGNTSSKGATDFSILEAILRLNYNNAHVCAPHFNPSVSASINNVNRLFSENIMTGEPATLFIDKSLTELIHAISSCRANGRGGIFKPSNPKSDKISHYVDALRYLVELASPALQRKIVGY